VRTKKNKIYTNQCDFLRGEPLKGKAIKLLLEGDMKDIEKNIAKELKSDPELVFSSSDNELFKRASLTANNQQGTKDLVALGMASIWVVFVSIFMKILKPIFKKMATKPITTSTNATTNESK